MLFMASGGEGKSNPTVFIIGVVVFIVAVFIVGNVALYMYAQKNIPQKPKKKIGAKKRQQMLLKKGLQPAGE